jgi:hypothetical protein
LRLGCRGNLLNHFARSPLWRVTLRRRRFLTPPAPPRETSARRIFPLTEPRGTRRSFRISDFPRVSIFRYDLPLRPRNLFTIPPHASISPCIGKVSSSPDLSGIFLIALNSRVY